MCGAERLESTSYWFVADEFGGEIRLRGWESPKKSRKNVKHLCGQKCVQRMMDNFTAAILAGQQAGKVAKDSRDSRDSRDSKDLKDVLPPTADTRDLDEIPILERMGYDRETVALIEADSWAGPAKPRDETWGADNRTQSTRTMPDKDFAHAARLKSQPVRPFQRMA
jgi:hypothetical protein